MFVTHHVLRLNFEITTAKGPTDVYQSHIYLYYSYKLKATTPQTQTYPDIVQI